MVPARGGAAAGRRGVVLEADVLLARRGRRSGLFVGRQRRRLVAGLVGLQTDGRCHEVGLLPTDISSTVILYSNISSTY
jgi:hypothetical protein